MMKKWIAVCLAVLTAVLLFSACGKQEITLQVKDNGEEQSIAAFTGMTVEEALSQAQITLDEKDVVAPERTEKITKDTSGISIKRYAEVTVTVDGKDKTVELVGGTVADALKEAKVTIGKDDALNMEKTAYVKTGDRIVVAKAVQIRVTADGETKTYATTKKTVEKALAAIGVKLGDNDKVSPDKSTKIKDGMEITVVRVTTKEVTEEETIAFATKTEYSSSMNKGTSQVRQQGVNGKKSVTYTCTYEDGKLVSKVKKGETVTKNAVPKIVVYGTKVVVQATRPQQPTTSGKTVVSRERVDDCDGSGHGYYIITYSDGTVKYEDY